MYCSNVHIIDQLIYFFFLSFNVVVQFYNNAIYIYIYLLTIEIYREKPRKKEDEKTQHFISYDFLFAIIWNTEFFKMA